MSEHIAPSPKGIADIVFLLDVTGSMKPCIDGLRENILSFIDTLTGHDANNECPVKDWRIKVAGYRDAEDAPSSWWVEFPFSRDIGEVKSYFAKLEAKGGGDEPESLLDALYKLGSMPAAGLQETDPADKWRARGTAQRVIVVFTDATYKTTMSAPECAGGGFDDVKNVIHGNKIILSVFSPEHDCYHDLSSLDRSEVEFIGSISEGAKLMVEFTRDQEKFKRTLAALAKTISKSSETPML
jgi:hypothetical protein